MKPSERIEELDTCERITTFGVVEAIIKYLDEQYEKSLPITPPVQE